MSDLGSWRFDTRAIAAGRPHAPGAPMNHPPELVSTYRMGGERIYLRDEGGTLWAAFEEALGSLEGGAAVAFASGMAAVRAVLAGVPLGGVVVAPTDCYSGTVGLLDDGAASGRYRPRYVEVTATERVLAACEGAALLWLESPTNPLIEIADLRALCAGARDLGVPVAVDNTFASPVLQRPLELGAAYAVHSVTKLIGGHSDLMMGAAVARDAEAAARLAHRRELEGGIPGALEAFLALRGLRTLPLRVERAQANAAELAPRLAGHPEVERVRYPGLPDDPGHRLAAEQMAGFGTMMSFDLVGDAARADAFCEALRLITPTTSLGGVETTLERRGRHRGQEHLPPSLIRMSVGCEAVEDLWADLDRALGATA